jgi:GDP-4-dehydro-6-deoxy-D-mannose reductase
LVSSRAVRVLITGITGFAGGHLAGLCARLGHEVHGLVRPGRESAAPAGAVAHAVTLTDPASVGAAIAAVAPERVVHLAGASSVGESFAAPVATWEANLLGTLGVLEALRGAAEPPLTLVVSSGEVYGRVADGELPVGPDTQLRPLSPYGASKAAADLAAGQYRSGYGLPVLRVRAFNQIGPGHDPRFVVPNVARQIARAERRGDAAVELRVGNVDTRRDFTDVRDMVDAYWRLLDAGHPDRVYLACSGRSTSVRELVDLLADLTPLPVTLVSDPGLRREGEQHDLYGSADRLAADTGWAPRISLRESLADTLESWRRAVATEER